MKKLLILLALTALVTACSDDEQDRYPSLITEMAVMNSDANGTIRAFTTDGGTTYTLSEAFTNVHANAMWRFLVGYALTEGGTADVYSLDPVVILRDSTSRTAAVAPVTFVSAWLGGGFVNFHLMPKTQGGVHSWGFRRDSTAVNADGGTNHYLSLYHYQGSDPMAYSADAYLSLALDSVAMPAGTTDSVNITLATFNGQRVCQFGLSY